MNKIVLSIVSITFFFSYQITKAENAPKATATAIYVDLSKQTGSLVEIRPGPSPDGKQVVRSFKISSGRPGMETPASPPDGWVVGIKNPRYWSNKYKCWMFKAVNIGAKNQLGQDDGDYFHVGRMPKAGYPASHGCIRLEEADATALYNWVQPGRTRVFITGTVQKYLEENFYGYRLLDFHTNGTIKGFKRNGDGTLTNEFMAYARQGKIDVHTLDRQGKSVPLENGVLAFEFFDKPWEQGIPKAEFEEAELGRIKTALGDLLRK